MTVRNLNAVFQPKSVAVIGASLRPGRMGQVVWQRLIDGGFEGPLWPVNPKYAHEPPEGLNGHTVFADVADLPGPPSVAVVCTPPHTWPTLVHRLGGLGTRAAILVGPATTDSDRADLRRALEAARPHLLRIVGPDSLGVFTPRLHAQLGAAVCCARAGGVAWVSQSNVLTNAVLSWADARGLGFSHVIALGDEADVDAGDVLDYLASDPATRAILLEVDTVRAARKFMSAARAAARNKPVLALRSGRGEPGDVLYTAVFRRAGIVRVNMLDDLLDEIEALGVGRVAASATATLITSDRGMASLVRDAFVDAGDALARWDDQAFAAVREALPHAQAGNPLLLGEDAQPEHFARALGALAPHHSTGTAVVIHAPTHSASLEEVARVLIEQQRIAYRGLLACFFGGLSDQMRDALHAHGIPVHTTPRRLARAFARLADYRLGRELLMQTPEDAPVQRGTGAIDAAQTQARAALAAQTARDERQTHEPGSAGKTEKAGKAAVAADRTGTAQKAHEIRKMPEEREACEAHRGHEGHKEHEAPEGREVYEAHEEHKAHEMHDGREVYETHEGHKAHEIHDGHGVCEAGLQAAHGIREAHEAHEAAKTSQAEKADKTARATGTGETGTGETGKTAKTGYAKTADRPDAKNSSSTVELTGAAAAALLGQFGLETLDELAAIPTGEARHEHDVHDTHDERAAPGNERDDHSNRGGAHPSNTTDTPKTPDTPDTPDAPPELPGPQNDITFFASLSVALAAGDAVTNASVRVVDIEVEFRDDENFGPVFHFIVPPADGVSPPLRAYGLPPLDTVLARDSISRLPYARCITLEPTLTALTQLSQAVCEVREIVGLRLTLRVMSARTVLVAPRIVLGAARSRFAIMPYPRRLEETIDWHGERMTIRPIRPQDEAQHRAFIESMTPEDLRLRFFSAVRGFDHSQLARVTQIDYDREMALVATVQDANGVSRTRGVVRAVTDPDNETTEFAVTVLSNQKGHGLGRLLMQKIIAYARSRGTHWMVGEALRENAAMINLARALGFTVTPTEDPSVVGFRLPLD